MLIYLIWLTLFVWLPLAALWATHKSLVLRYKKTLVMCAGLALLFSIPWDVYAIGSGIWSFVPSGLLGIYILNMPIEEYFFIIFLTLLISTVALILKQDRFLRLRVVG